MKAIARTVLKASNQLEVKVLIDGAEETLFFESDKPLWPVAPENDDYIVLALTQYCSAKKLDLYVDGTVTQSMLRNVDEFIKIWSVWRPDLFSQINIEARNVVKDELDRDKPAVIAFSGGVDSCFSLAAHKSGIMGPSTCDIKMGILIVGFDIKPEQTHLLELSYQKAKEMLAVFDADCAIVKTNWQGDFCPEWLMGFPAGVASIMHSLVNDYSAGIFSNNSNYLEELELPPHGALTTVTHCLGSYTFPIVITGGTHSRLERIGLISKYPVLIENLRICFLAHGKGINCGVCEKCVRTRLELMVYNMEPDVFDAPLEARYIEEMNLSGFPFIFFEEIYLNFPKEHPLFEVIENKYLITKEERLDPVLVSEMKQKDIEISRLKNEISAIYNTKSYRITKPLRSFRKVFQIR